jgi:hypothetical protein
MKYICQYFLLRKFIRTSLCRYYTSFHNHLIFGGHGKAVEIDETLLKGRRKYNSGRMRDYAWVVGILERGCNNIDLHSVKHRDAKTLLGIFKGH